MINLELPDNNKEAVKKARAKTASTKKALKSMEEYWDDISRMKTSATDQARLKDVKELMEAGVIGRLPDKVGKAFTKTEALNIYKVNAKVIRNYGFKEYYEKDLDLYPLINSQELMDEFVGGFRKASLKRIGMDTETEGYSGGIDVYRERMSGWSATYFTDEGKEVNGYVPILHKVTDPVTGEVLDELDELNCPLDVAVQGLKDFAEIADETIWHNASFDLHVCMTNFGITFRGIVHDTLVMMKLLDENRMSYKLKDLVTQLLGMPSDTFEAMFGKDAKFAEVPIMVARWYAAKDTKVTYALFNYLMKEFGKAGNEKLLKLYTKIECPIIKITSDMEAVGFEIDLEEVDKQLEEGVKEIEELEMYLKQVFPEVKLTSWQQLQKAFYYDRDLSRHAIGKSIHKGVSVKLTKPLFKEAGKNPPKAAIKAVGVDNKPIVITPMNNVEEYNNDFGWALMASGEIKLGKIKRLPSGQNFWEQSREKLPTDSKTLKKLATVNEDIGKIKEYRDVTKHIGSFVSKMRTLISPDDRLHGSFNQLGTVTGRYSSNNPNLQNLPYKARRFYIAPKGQLILSGDLGSQEPRLLAHYSRCQDLMNIFIQERDVYSEMASKTFGVPIEECYDGSEFRKQMKMIYLAVTYGMGKYSLADILKIEADEAQAMIDDFFNGYPEVEQWINQNEKKASTEKYVETMYGSRRRFNNVDFSVLNKRWTQDIAKARGAANRAMRQASNSMIQGAAAYQVKQIMVRMVEVLDSLNKSRGTNLFQIVAQVHDELLYYVPEDVTPAELWAIEDVMINTVKLIVPSKTDLALGVSWGDLKGVQYKGLPEVMIEAQEGFTKLSQFEWRNDYAND